MQALSDDALETCPECEAPIRRVIGGAQCVLNPMWDTKKKLSDGNLKRLGFKKLVKEGDGSTATSWPTEPTVSRPRKPRVRQHANPLSYREPLVVPDWGEVLADPALPREVDVGCAHADFLLGRARSRPDLNLIGLEIREPMVERVNRRIAREGIPNATVVRCNANTALDELFGPRSLQRVYVHFPDPGSRTATASAGSSRRSSSTSWPGCSCRAGAFGS